MIAGEYCYPILLYEIMSHVHLFSVTLLSCSGKCHMQVLGKHEPNVILKDNDLKFKNKMYLSDLNSAHFLDQLGKDTEFLCSLGVMDYSLLVGVHTTHFYVNQKEESEDHGCGGSDNDPCGRTISSDRRSSSVEVKEQRRSNGRFQATRVVGPEAYYMGIVDFQQQYDFEKKVMLMCTWRGVSCVKSYDR